MITSRRRLLKNLAGAGFLPAVTTFQTSASTSANVHAAVEPSTCTSIGSRERHRGAPGRTLVLGRSDECYPRHSEGDLVELGDGSILAVWSRFQGRSDHARSELVGRGSRNSGATWSHLKVISSLEEPGHRSLSNLMSASLIRLQESDQTLLFYLGKSDLEGKQDAIRCSIFLRRLGDDGWSNPVQISDSDHYYIVNNARVIELSSGRILVPAAVSLSPDDPYGWSYQSCLTFYSDDSGKSWTRGQACRIEPDGGSERSRFTAQEPGLLELEDGRVLMVIRTRLGHPYASLSENRGESWSPPEPIESVVAPASPQTLFRLSDSENSIGMIYNHNPRGAEARWDERFPLSFSISSDEGRTFQFRKNVESAPGRCWAYPSVRLIGDQVFLSYYEWIQGEANFFFTDFRLSIIPQDWFRS